MTPALISVRDSKQNDPAGNEDSQPILNVEPQAWLTFLSEVLEQSPAGTNESLFFSRQSNGDMVLTNAAQPDISLRYDSEEWDAFSAGVADGDFGPIPTTTA